jgi:hypothetical protein
MLRTRWPVVLFVAWSAYVWVTRIVNALGDDTANKPFSVTLSLSVLALVVATGVVLVRARDRGIVEVEGRLWQAAAGWTALVWLVRGAEIVMSDHVAAFKVVHVVVGVVSIVFAAATWRVAREELAAASPPRVSPPVGAGR